MKINKVPNECPIVKVGVQLSNRVALIFYREDFFPKVYAIAKTLCDPTKITKSFLLVNGNFFEKSLPDRRIVIFLHAK